MNEREILAAALRWHTTHEARLAIGAEKARQQKAEREAYRAGRSTWLINPSSYEIGLRLTPAKRKELAALRELAKVCAKVRGSQRQVEDAAQVIDVEVRMLSQVKV